jgi:hypothetical protein
MQQYDIKKLLKKIKKMKIEAGIIPQTDTNK